MKKAILFLFLFLTANFPVTAQVKVYKGTSTYTSDVICTVKDGKIYKKNSSRTSDIEFTFKGKLFTVHYSLFTQLFRQRYCLSLQNEPIPIVIAHCPCFSRDLIRYGTNNGNGDGRRY